KYCPGDRVELLKRLVSFQELTDWTPKPEAVNEVQWAKHGWICNGKERVRCTLCNKELIVRLNKKEVDGKEVAVLVPSEIEEALVQKYVELIVTSHQDDCLWRKRGCDDCLLRLPLSNRQAAIQDLRKRYDELCTRNAFLPYEFNLRLPAMFSIDAILDQLPLDFFSHPPPPPSSATPSSPIPNRVALALAVLGWQGLDNPRIGPVPNTASCHTCFRRLGLWMFKSKEIDPATEKVLVPAPMDHLDPLREHRFFCPWKNAEAQRISSDTGSRRRMRLAADEDDMAGWQVLLQVLKNEAYLRDRETPNKRSSKPPQTPRRSIPGESGPMNSSGAAGSDIAVEDALEGEGDEKGDAEKDKERWARLRRVRSMLSVKGARK
ncbi:C3HC zinc finger-like-domain-containing protein, partial [Coniella lustricola]